MILSFRGSRSKTQKISQALRLKNKKNRYALRLIGVAGIEPTTPSLPEIVLGFIITATKFDQA